MTVPLVDLVAQFDEIDEELRAALETLFATASFVGGPSVDEFERAYAAFLGVRECVGVANGTDALELAFRAVGVGRGGEVILPANSFIATAEAVSRTGATPVLVDVDPAYLLIDPDWVESAVTSRTQAIAPVHLFGQTAPVEEIHRIADRVGVPVVEDAAQAQGARRHGRAAGALGTVAATSFYPGKNLGAAGDAGAVTTDDPELARTVRLLGAHGSETKYEHEIVGMNSRLDSIQAAVLRAKLARLEKWNELRRQAAARYDELLENVPGLVLPTSAPGNEDVWHLYVIRVDNRDEVLRHLNDAGVGAGIHYPTPIHLTGAYRHLGQARGSFPVAEAAADQMISLPLHPHILPEQQEYVAQQLSACLG
ncbi:MAG: DegT/DnrJ/EryC1/StrS family aminotransferase [Nocardioides sp.]